MIPNSLPIIKKLITSSIEITFVINFQIQHISLDIA